MESIDLVVPLGNGSRSNNDELRIMLRSAEENVRDLGRVIVVTHYPPSWLQNAEILDVEDSYAHNKDGNMIHKVEMAAEAYDLGRFCLLCDDFIFMKETWLSKIPAIYNCRGKSNFSRSGNRWQNRVIRTFEYCEQHGHPIAHNFEAHVPQVYDAKVLMPKLKEVDYGSGLGYSIFTLFHFLSGTYDGVEQSAFKTTHESIASAKANMPHQFVSFNDEAFLHGLRKRLLERFPKPSRFEKNA